MYALLCPLAYLLAVSVKMAVGIRARIGHCQSTTSLPAWFDLLFSSFLVDLKLWSGGLSLPCQYCPWGKQKVSSAKPTLANPHLSRLSESPNSFSPAFRAMPPTVIDAPRRVPEKREDMKWAPTVQPVAAMSLELGGAKNQLVSRGLRVKASVHMARLPHS